MRSFLLYFFAILWAVSLSADEGWCGRSLFQLVPSGVERWLAENSVRHPREIREKNRVIVVVPVYREWENGNLRRLIEYFRGQSASPSSFEMVFLVNNTPEIAAAKNSVWRENQETLAYLKHLVVGFSHRVIDGATEGIERNIGAIRDRAIRTALADVPPDRLSETVVAFFDADTEPPKQYIENIQDAFVPPSTVVAVSALDSKLEPGAQIEIFETFFTYGSAYFEMDLEAAFSGTTPTSGIPRIAVRADHFLRVGGVPHVDWAEDKKFLDLAAASVHDEVRYLWRNPVLTADRARPDGYDARNRYNAIYRIGLPENTAPKTETPSEQPLPDQIYIQAHLTRLLRDLPEDEKALVESEMINQLARVRLDQSYRTQALKQLVADRAAGKDIDDRDWRWSPLADFWTTSWFFPWLAQQAAEGNKTPEQVAQAAAKKFPGFFEPPTRNVMDAAQLHAREVTLQRIFSLAREFPNKFPGLRNYLEAYQSLSDEDFHGRLVTTLRELPEKLVPNSPEWIGLKRLLGQKERPPALSSHYHHLVYLLAQEPRQLGALMSVLNPDPDYWTAEDWIVGKNVTELLFQAFDFFSGLMEIKNATERRNAIDIQVLRWSFYLRPGAGPFNEALGLVLLGSVDRKWAKELESQISEPEERTRGIARLKELASYWHPKRFKENLSPTWWETAP